MKVSAGNNLWGFGCVVLHNARIDIDKHRQVEAKYCLPLQDFINNSAWQKKFSYQSVAFTNRYRCVVRLMGEDIEFTNEALVLALGALAEKQRRIVLLYYGIKKTDEEICNLLGLKNRSLVQYHRQKAIEKLRKLMDKMEGDEYVFL